MNTEILEKIKPIAVDPILEKIKPIVGDTINEAARAKLHSLYPKEFEVYMLTLELTDIQGKTLDLFTFPINPKTISKIEPYTKSISRAYNNIIVTKNGTFTPRDIILRGNFGRTFKVLYRKIDVVFHALKGVGELSTFLKGGYGCIKVLQSICQASNELDSKDNPYLLYFHNYTLGESYLVEVLDLNIDLDTSMIYSYSLRLKILKEVNKDIKNTQFLFKKNIATKTIQNTAQVGKNILGGVGKNILGGVGKNILGGVGKNSLGGVGKNILGGLL